MKKIYCFLLLTFGLYAQNTNWSIEVNYPILVDQNLVGANFDGLFEVGAKYIFWENVSFKTGVSLHTGLFQDKERIQDLATDFDVLVWTLQPRVFGELFLPSLPKFHPIVGVGYSAVTFFTNGNNFTFFPEGTETRYGINVIAGFSLEVSPKWYFHAHYDFIQLSKSGNFNNPYLQNINLVKVGVGFRL
ncbi:MAG: outer membrane beta-barrel protein [Flavobacterium sp.]